MAAAAAAAVGGGNGRGGVVHLNIMWPFVVRKGSSGGLLAFCDAYDSSVQLTMDAKRLCQEVLELESAADATDENSPVLEWRLQEVGLKDLFVEVSSHLRQSDCKAFVALAAVGLTSVAEPRAALSLRIH